jgi:group I intron endonuclease
MSRTVDIFAPGLKLDSVRGVSGIYRITSPTGRVYVGQAQDIGKRWADHKRSAVGGYHPNRIIQRSVSKNGIESHSFDVVEICPLEELDQREQAWIDACLVLGEKVRMNISPTAGSNRGLIPSKETREKLSAALKGRVVPEETRKNMSLAQKGRVISEETRARLSAARQGRVISEETRAKTSASLKGRSFSEEHRAKISAAAKIRGISEETRKKTSAALKGRPLSEEHRAKLSATRRGRPIQCTRRLAPEQILEIRQRILRKEPMKSIGESVGVSAATICLIGKGKRYADVA